MAGGGIRRSRWHPLPGTLRIPETCCLGPGREGRQEPLLQSVGGCLRTPPSRKQQQLLHGGDRPGDGVGEEYRGQQHCWAMPTPMTSGPPQPPEAPRPSVLLLPELFWAKVSLLALAADNASSRHLGNVKLPSSKSAPSPESTRLAVGASCWEVCVWGGQERGGEPKPRPWHRRGSVPEAASAADSCPARHLL